MAVRLARSYGIIVFVCNLLVVSCALVLHLGLLMVRTSVSTGLVGLVFQSSVLAGIAATAFMKNGLKWKEQIKTCPQWMWRPALGLGLYALFICCLELIFPPGPAFDDRALTLSAFPMAGAAISSCVVYSALRSTYVERRELPKMAGISLGLLAFMGLLYLIHRGGFWLPSSVGSINSN